MFPSFQTIKETPNTIVLSQHLHWLVSLLTPLLAPLQLFVGGEWLGSGETVLEMNERGELEEVLSEYKVGEICGDCVWCVVVDGWGTPCCRETWTAVWWSVGCVVDTALCCACGVVAARRASRMLSMTSSAQCAIRTDCSCVQSAPPDTTSLPPSFIPTQLYTYNNHFFYRFF